MRDHIDRCLTFRSVSEEYADHGDTGFATKKELCEVILYWSKKADEHWNRRLRFAMEISMTALNEVFPDKPTDSTEAQTAPENQHP